MSTVSGVFPNAITPTFAPSTDPASSARLRRENETIVFTPVEQLEENAGSRRTAIEQPGRLEAEQNVKVTEQALFTDEAAEADRSADISATEGSGESGRFDVRDESRRSQDTVERSAAESDDLSDIEQAQLEADLALIEELAARDQEVRAHEQAHQSVGGQYAGSMEFTYTTGPDGVRYATGGEVPISVSEIPDNPEATLEKARTVRAAALAPAEPSAQDRQVAALASQMILDAQVEIRQEATEAQEAAAEESSEQSDLNSEAEERAEATSEAEEERSALVAEQNEERLQEILQKTQESVISALEAAYQSERREDIGFNLDTTV